MQQRRGQEQRAMTGGPTSSLGRSVCVKQLRRSQEPARAVNRSSEALPAANEAQGPREAASGLGRWQKPARDVRRGCATETGRGVSLRLKGALINELGPEDVITRRSAPINFCCGPRFLRIVRVAAPKIRSALHPVLHKGNLRAASA